MKNEGNITLTSLLTANMTRIRQNPHTATSSATKDFHVKSVRTRNILSSLKILSLTWIHLLYSPVGKEIDSAEYQSVVDVEEAAGAGVASSSETRRPDFVVQGNNNGKIFHLLSLSPADPRVFLSVCFPNFNLCVKCEVEMERMGE